MAKHNRWQHHIVIHACQCPNCGRYMFVPRRKNKLRERGHRKRLYCPYCKRVTNMYEESEWETVRDEPESGDSAAPEDT